MDLHKSLVDRATWLAKKRAISTATLATEVVNDGKFFDRITHGKTCTLRTFERFQSYFDANGVPKNPTKTRGV